MSSGEFIEMCADESNSKDEHGDGRGFESNSVYNDRSSVNVVTNARVTVRALCVQRTQYWQVRVRMKGQENICKSFKFACQSFVLTLPLRYWLLVVKCFGVSFLRHADRR
jgi:hypothetical protein